MDPDTLSPGEVLHRLAWARRQGHPHFLWPDVTVRAWRDALTEITRATAAVLTEAPMVVLDPDRRHTTRALGIAGFTSGMGPLLGYWIERGQVDAAPPVAGLLGRHLTHGRRRWSRVLHMVRDVSTRLAQHDISPTAVKGVHTAAAYFPDPGTRPLTDVDLVVSPGARDTTTDILKQAGYRATTRLRTPYRCDWVKPGEDALASLDLTHADNPLAIDLHTSLERVFSGVRNVNVGSPWPGTMGLPTIDPRLRGLRQPVVTALLALHASEELHHLQLMRLVELALVIRRDVDGGDLRWDDLVGLLERHDALDLCYPAFALTERLAPGTIDAQVRCLLEAAASPLMRRVVRRLSPGTTQRLDRRSVTERFIWARGPREALRCAIRLMTPGRTTATPRGRAWRERLLRLVRGRISMRTG